MQPVNTPAQHSPEEANRRVDSLSRELQRQTATRVPPDSALFSLCYRLSDELCDRLPDSAITVSRQALQIASELHDSSSIALAYYALGYACKNRGLFSLALEYHLAGVRIAERVGNLTLVARNSNGLGLCI